MSPSRIVYLFISCVLLLGFSVNRAFSQINQLPGFIVTTSLPDLEFPARESAVSEFKPDQMALFKPDGAGPFPALVLSPTCAGAGRHLEYWVQEGVKAGFVVLVLDHMSQRRVGVICGKRSDLTFGQGAKDAFAALDYLGGLSYVAPKKISLMGFSWGGAIAYLVSSQSAAHHFRLKNKSGLRYAAAIGAYPVCHHPAFSSGPNNVPELDFVFPDIDRPLLALLAELDHEEDPLECSKRMAAAKQKGATVDWLIIPAATHAWDNPGSDGKSSSMPWMPKGGTFRYNPRIREASRDHAFTFLQKAFAAQ